jgi:hypothetical protein
MQKMFLAFWRRYHITFQVPPRRNPKAWDNEV